MNCRSHHQGFTRKELLVALVLVAAPLYYLGISRGGSRIMPRVKANFAATKARDIHTALTAWAEDHNQEYPTARQYSNEAFRELFRAKLIDEGGEKLFTIPGDAWHKNSPSGNGADGIIGPAPDFPQTLQRGECAFYYVSGLGTASPSYLPLVGNAFSGSPGVYTDDPSHKGGVFRGTKGAWVNVGGTGYVGPLSSDFRLRDWKDHKANVDIFSKEWGTNPDNIKNPEG